MPRNLLEIQGEDDGGKDGQRAPRFDDDQQGTVRLKAWSLGFLAILHFYADINAYLLTGRGILKLALYIVSISIL